MGFLSSYDCFNIVKPLYDEVRSSPDVCVNLTRENLHSLMNYCAQTSAFEVENKYSNPVVWIGIYITIASLFCILSMGTDLLHGFRNRKFWFPCKYFTLNAASITVITVAMKLPLDLSSSMPTSADQAAKLGSIAFMCTMMANLMPSLASMNNKALLANVIGLVILVITMIVNICIEISTGVISNVEFGFSTKYYFMNFMIVAYIYIVVLLSLLIILISSAITIPAFKQILELKYQAKCKRILRDQDIGMSMVENIRQYMRRYWVMAESGSPQFVMASIPLSFSTGIICIISLVIYILMVLQVISRRPLRRYQSNFQWSMIFIAKIQFAGVVVGSIAPIFRCFTIMSFKKITKQNKIHFMVFKVEKYWIQKLCEWKESHISVISSGSMSKTHVYNLKNLILSLSIKVQEIIVVSSKMLRLIPIVLLVSVVYCSNCWKSLMAMLFTDLTTPPVVPRVDDINEDLSNYVLLLEDEMELGERALKRMSNFVNHLIQLAEKEQHNNLLMLLELSTGFMGVENFDVDQVPLLVSVNLANSWSLPVVTMTSIAITLPNIHKDVVNSLFKSVREGLLYTHLVEETLNSTCEYDNIRRATMTLWHEVQEQCMWLENTLEKSFYEGKTSLEILECFANKAEEIVVQISKSTDEELTENTPKKLILANSMYRITRTILFNCQNSVEPISEEELFTLLFSMIADIFSACFTNIPRVIMMKCHRSTIEKREGSVEATAKLFGRTMEIIKRLEVLEQPSMDPDKMAFIDEWRLHLKQAVN